MKVCKLMEDALHPRGTQFHGVHISALYDRNRDLFYVRAILKGQIINSGLTAFEAQSEKYIEHLFTSLAESIIIDAFKQQGVPPNGLSRQNNPQVNSVAPQVSGAAASAANQSAVAATLRQHNAIQHTLQNYFNSNSFGIDTPTPKLPCSGVVLGELVAFRGWYVENGWLKSYSQPDFWPPGEVKSAQKVGSEEDGGGIHAFKTKDHLLRFAAKDCTKMTVLGSVFLFGDIVEHELGYRAEFAQLRSIDGIFAEQERHSHAIQQELKKQTPPLLRKLRRRYREDLAEAKG